MHPTIFILIWIATIAALGALVKWLQSREKD
jgi:hypothetical protein